MTSKEFNEKYKSFIETTTYVNRHRETITQSFGGLEFDIPEVTDFLDKIFQDLTKVPGFSYSQIKLKFGQARFYSTACHTVGYLIEDKINEIIKQQNNE